jgi:hypothetical protein
MTGPCPSCGCTHLDGVCLSCGCACPAVDPARCPCCGTTDPVEAVNALGTVWAHDFDDYASGQLDAAQVRCVLCGLAPCACPPFGTREYFALVDQVHGQRRGQEDPS